MTPRRSMKEWVGNPKTPYVFMIAAYVSTPIM
jgi:hypothetical protein